MDKKEFLAKPEIKALPGEIRKRLVDFIYREIPNTHFLHPDGNPKKEWKIFYGDTWRAARYASHAAAEQGAARDAARSAARYAAWDAARGAGWHASRNAAWYAAWDAAWGTARSAARYAAWGAARYASHAAAWYAAWDAAWDARLISYYLLTSDLKVSAREKHLAHAKARWEVWRKGYALLCDVDGVLYVYAKR